MIYKKSAYSIYFMERKMKLASGKKSNIQKELRRFKKAHDEHYATLKKIEAILSKYGIDYKKSARGKRISYARYDLIITLGGDGTFLEAARYIKDQVIMGVNTAPSFSRGQLCLARRDNFERVIQRLIKNQFQIHHWPRLRISLEGHVRPVDCVNDALICHSNPAAMSRYHLKIGKITEEQRNSGLWISTPAGSTGGVRSAGGKALKRNTDKIQYMPRELYYGFNPSYRLTGGVLSARQNIEVTSLMRSGMIYIDGTHHQLKLPFNATVKISVSPQRLKTVQLT